MISFNGEYIKPLTIMRRDQNNEFSETNSALVKLSCYDQNDIDALRNATKSWKNSKGFGLTIAQCMQTLHELCVNYDCPPGSDYYIATLQKDCFEKIESEKILGVIRIENLINNDVDIDFFEVKPEFSHNNPLRELKGIGHAIIHAVKKLHQGKKLDVLPTEEAEEFYIKEGFKKKNKHLDTLTFECNNEK